MKKLYAILGTVVVIEIISIVLLTSTGFGKIDKEKQQVPIVLETQKPTEQPDQLEQLTDTPSIQPTATPVQNGITEAEDGVLIEVVNEMVQAKSNVFVRESYSTNGKKVGTLIGGTEVLRTGICDNGWSQVEFSGEKAYIKSEYLLDIEQTAVTNTPKLPVVTATPKTKVTN